ncbi:unnamed protein product, partial [Iphiclides podalirius]
MRRLPKSDMMKLVAKQTWLHGGSAAEDIGRCRLKGRGRGKGGGGDERKGRRGRGAEEGGQVKAAARNKAPSGNRHNTGLRRRAIPSQIQATGQVMHSALLSTETSPAEKRYLDLQLRLRNRRSSLFIPLIHHQVKASN